MEIAAAWHELRERRKSFPVPSTHHQTLVSKSIFEHCLDYADVASIALSSKAIQDSSLSANFASNIVIDEKSVVIFQNVFHPDSSLPMTFLQRLIIRKPSASVSAFIEKLKTTKYFCKSLRTLSLGFVYKLEDFLQDPSTTKKTFLEFSALESLELMQCKISTRPDKIAEVFNSAFPRLESVAFTCTGDFPNELGENMPKLKKYKFNSSSPLFNEGAGAKMIDLESLSICLSYREDPAQTLREIGQLPRLTSLTFPYGFLPEDHFKLLCVAIGRRLRNFTSSAGLNDEHLKSIGENLTNLASLEIESMRTATNAGFSYLRPLIVSPQLERLQLGKSDALTNGGWLDLFENISPTPAESLQLQRPPLSSSIQELSLTMPYQISAPTLGSTLSRLHLLRSLKLYDCNIEDHALASILSSAKLLQTLRLENCENLEFKSSRLQAISMHEMKNLLIAKALRVSDESISTIVNLFPNLQKLEFFKCGKLEYLSSSSREKNNNESECRIAELEFLEELSFWQCERIREDVIINLLLRRTKLKKTPLRLLDLSQILTMTRGLFEAAENELSKLCLLMVSSREEDFFASTVEDFRKKYPHAFVSRDF